MGSYTAAKKMYPILDKYDYKIVDTPNEDSPYYLEHFPPGEVGSLEMPRPKDLPLEEYGLQIFKDVRPEDIAGDIISHHIVNKDKYLSEKYEDFKTSTSLDVMKERYKYHKENFNEQRDFNSWLERTGYPELFRGYVFNQFDGEAKKDLYSPKQKTILNEIKKYITKKPKDFAEGGLTMNNQTEMMLQEGGIADDGMKRDPVSGNEIPPGSMAKEVRDDVPANLSEGEYVVPADVVRFFGVKYFEDLRMQAKQGLLEMEKDGRIGGEPTPRLPAGAPPSGAGEISEEELMQILKEELGNAEPQEKAGPQPIRMMNKGGYASTSMSSYRKNFNEGGVVNAAEGVDVAPKYKSISNTYGGANVGTDRGMTSVPYENASGDVMYFTFINGRLYPRGIKIPTGFNPMAGYEDLVPASLQTNPVDTAPAQTSEPAVVNNNDDDDMTTAEREALAETENGSTRWMDKFKLNSTTGTSATNTEIINSAKEILNSAGDSDFTIKGLSLLNPIAGVFGLAGRASSAAQVAGVLISLNDSMMKDEKGDPIKNAEWLSLKGQLDEFKTQYGLNKLPQEFLNGDMFAKQINTTINDLALSRNAIDLDGNPIFKNDAQWNNQMQSNAPTGMLYDSDTGEYNRDTDPFQDIQGVTKSVDRDDPDFDYNVFEITDKKAFEESGGIRPKLNPMTTGKTVTTKKVSANENPAPVVANSGDKNFTPNTEYEDYEQNRGGLITKRKKKKK